MMENVKDPENSDFMLNHEKGNEKSDLKTDFNENLSKDLFSQSSVSNQQDVNEFEHTSNCDSNPSESLQNSLDRKFNDTLVYQQQIIEKHSTRIRLLEETRTKLEQMNEELNIKIDKVIKQRDVAIKEKEAIVVRYAIGEKNVLMEKQQKECTEKKYKEILRENEILQHKYQIMVSEKARICQMFDNKCYEHKNILLELEKVKSDLSSLETKLKWLQNSLKNEIEAHKECQSEVESVNTKLQEVTNQIEQTKKDAEHSITAFYTSQENRAHILDIKLQEHQASLILLKHEKKDREERIKTLEIELQRLQQKQNEWLQENSNLSLKVQQLEREKLDTNQKLCELRGYADQQRQDFADLQAKSVQLQQVKLQLKHEQDQLMTSTEQINFLKQRNSELESDMESCRTREAELLLFTQQLTEKNVRLQSEFTALETKVQQLSCEQILLKRQMKDNDTKVSMVSGKLSEERLKYTDIVEKLNRDLLEKTRLCDQYKQEVVDQMGEKILTKRKFDMSMREVNKELQHLRKKLEQFESADTTSSSSSNSSLNVNERPMEQELVKVIQPDTEIDKQTLIEHIVKLQRLSAKKSEKIDFLEEHINTLVAELQKKTKLLQSYVLREQCGTLTSNSMDKNKEKLAKMNGIMASVYSSRIADNNLTLELSLDINRKLQAVLEDVLLKNITLKENVDTLGTEIDRLNKLLKS